MRLSVRLVIVAALLLSASASQAQFYGGYGGYRQQQGVAFHVRTGPYSSFSYVAGSYGFGYGPVYGPVPAWYYGQPGIPIINNPFTVQRPIVINNIINNNAPAQVLPAAPAHGAIIPAEFEGAAARPAPKAAKLPKPKGPAIMPDPPKVPAFVNRADADRIADEGRKAFTNGQYGRAVELFGRAAELSPNEPSNHWLVSQANFALGKYREAVEAIAAGMAIRADWSEARFVARDLYWKKPELFDDHIKALRQALEAFPNDATLLFLLGHELWFDGSKEEGKTFILKAKALGKGLAPAEKFFR